MTLGQKLRTYLDAIARATSLEAAQRDARLALRVIDKAEPKPKGKDTQS